MPRVIDLKHQIQDTFDAAYRLVNAAEQAGQALTPEEEGRFEQLMSQGQRLRLDLELLEQGMRPPDHTPLHCPPGVVDFAALPEAEQRRVRATWSSLPTDRQAQGRYAQPVDRWQDHGPGYGPGPRTYAGLFGPPHPSGFEPGEWLAILQQHVHDPRLEIASAMNEGEGSRGGFYVPQELQAMVLDPVLHASDFLSRALVVPMTSLTKVIPSFDGIDQQPTSNLYGFTFQWLGELEQVTPGTGATRAITLHANLGGIYVEMSNELWADSGTEFQTDFTDRVTAALQTNIEQGMLTGNGVGQPLGVLNAGSLLQVAPVATQADHSLVYDNATAMFAASSSPTTAIWCVNPKALPQLMRTTVKETGDTASSFVPLVVQGANGSLSMLGRPLVVSSLLPAPGNVGDLVLVDWKSYVVGLRKRWILEFSQAPGWFRNAQNARILVRLDGQPRVNQHMIGADGQTYSPFVAIAERIP